MPDPNAFAADARAAPETPALPALLGLALAYFALAYACIQLSRLNDAIAFIWLPNALAVGRLLSRPRQAQFPGIAACALANALANLAAGNAPLFAAGLALANALSIALGVGLGLRLLPAEQRLRRQPVEWPGLLRLFGAYLFLAVPPAAALGAGLVWWHFGGDWSLPLRRWWIGETIGTLLILYPSWQFDRERARALLRPVELARRPLELAGLVLLAYVILHTLDFPFVYISAPLVLLALRDGALRTALLANAALLLLGLSMLSGLLEIPAVLQDSAPVAIWSACAMAVFFPLLLGTVTETARRHAERLQLATTAVGFGVWEIDLEHHQLFWDDNMFRLYWLERREGMDLLAAARGRVHPEDLAELDARTAEALSRHERFSWRFRLRGPEGELRRLHSEGQLLRGPDGQVRRIVGMSWDVTETERAAQALRDARDAAESAAQVKSEFLANMSHELRTPMNAVLGITRLLGHTRLDGEQRRYLGMVQSAGQSLLAILNDILDFSKIEAGRLRIEPAAFELAPVLDAVAQLMSVNAGAKPLELGLRVAPDVPARLVGDALRLQQLLVNLTGNAIKFTESGEVWLNVSRCGGSETVPILRFAVRDTGQGIAPAQLATLFTPFTQADGSATRRFDGTGLGLAICKRLVGLMGGELGADSEAGRGSEFWFTLPLAAPTAGAATRPRPATGRLLIVDDHADALHNARRLAEAGGWQADTAESGAAALERLAAPEAGGRRYDALLLDWQMPDLDGPATLRALRRLPGGGQLPVLLMANAHWHADARESLAEDPTLGLLLKPLTAGVLRERLQDLLGGRRETLPAAGGPRLDGKRLLLVEDNELNQVVTQGLLERQGARLDITGDGQEAMTRLRQDAAYDAILMDVQMPVMDGFTATRRIRGELGWTGPIIAMSAGVTESEREQCAAAGMDDFIAKPLQAEEMLRIIAKHLGATPPPGVAANQEPAAPAFDPGPLLTCCAGNPERMAALRRFIADALARAPGRLAAIRDHLATGAWGEAERDLHNLRGSLGMLGAARLVAQAQALETALKAGPPPDWTEPLSGLDATLDKLCREASAWLADQADSGGPPGVEQKQA